jgi:glyoxylase-like metal-dependent hydrolase (beta-lactamase superfamily II)
MISARPSSNRIHNLSRRDALRLFGLAGAGAFLGSTLVRAGDAAPGATPAAGPTLAGAQPGFYRFKIGALEALAVNDGGFGMPPADSPFGIGEPREKVTEVLRDALAPTDMVRLPFNVLVVRMGAELLMIDAGCGSVFGPAGGRLVGNLAAAGVKPEQITGIVISHMHGDHFGGLLDAARQPVFRNAKLFIHRTEHAFWTSSAAESLGAETVAGVRAYLDAFKGKWQFIAGGEKLLGGLEIVDAFGHTPGHLALMIGSGSDQLMHFVDVVHHHAISFARPEWVMQYDVQPDVAIATRKHVLERVAADRVRVFGAHMPFPALGRVRKAGAAYEYVIEPWVSA